MGGSAQKTIIILVISTALIVTGIYYFTRISFIPTDTKIVQTLESNKKFLLGVEGVIGAGIARDKDNHIIGIAVYVEDNIIDTQKIPAELGEFRVFIKR